MMVSATIKDWHSRKIQKMAALSVISAAATASLIKKIFDDIYDSAKKSGGAFVARARSDVKEAPIARALNSITKVKTLWNIEKEVSLYDFYYPSTVEFSDGIVKKITSIKDFGGVGHFVIQGTAGQGKSIFLRYLSGQELNPQNSSGRVPVFIELRRMTKEHDLQSLILSSLEKFRLPATSDTWAALAESGKFALLLDAFDEIDPLLVTQAINDLENIAELYRDRLQIIITSRPDSDIQKSNLFRVFKLCQLTPADHGPFLRKICDGKDQSESLLKVLRQSKSEVSSLLATPLMMTLLVILYKSLQTIPDTLPKFYEELFDVLFYRHDHSKPGFRRKRYTQLDDGAVKKIFSAFCFYARLKGYGILTNQQLHECCDQASTACNQTVDPEKFKLELVKTICLMQEEGFEISFIHKSVAQYYAASFVKNSSEDFARRFYNLAQQHRSWELELRFLSQIDAYRFSKYFELPQLKKFAEAVGFDIGSELSTDSEKIHDYLSRNILIVSRQALDSKDGGVDFVGWADTGDGINLLGHYTWMDLTHAWVQSVIAKLNKVGAPQLRDEASSPETGAHVFTKIGTYEKYLSDTKVVEAEVVRRKFMEKFKNCEEIINAEENKARMLDMFMLA